jgi:hypothetical protein
MSLGKFTNYLILLLNSPNYGSLKVSRLSHAINTLTLFTNFIEIIWTAEELYSSRLMRLDCVFSGDELIRK